MKLFILKGMVFPFLLSMCFLKAQITLPLTNNGLRNDLQKVLDDFSRNFPTLKGDVIEENAQSVEYSSLLKFSGAEENEISRFNSSRPIYSWRAIMLTTEEFKEAVKKYKWLFNQLKNMTVKLNAYSFSLDGNYDEPVESKQFSESIFHLLPSAVNLPKLKIEVTLQYEFPSWKVGLQVFEKEREDNERGNIKEDQPNPK